MNEFSQVDELTISISPCQIAIAGLGFACVLCAVMAKMQEELKPNGLRSGLCFASHPQWKTAGRCREQDRETYSYGKLASSWLDYV
jgi:hypothetical protein